MIFGRFENARGFSGIFGGKKKRAATEVRCRPGVILKLFGGSEILDLVLHPVAFALHDHSLGVVEEAVQDSGSQCGVAVEDLRPVFVGLVGRQDDGSPLVAFADHLKEEVSAQLVDGKIPDLIDA